MMRLNLEAIRDEAKRLHSLGPIQVAELLAEVKVLEHFLNRLAKGDPVQYKGQWIKPDTSGQGEPCQHAFKLEQESHESVKAQ